MKTRKFKFLNNPWFKLLILTVGFSVLIKIFSGPDFTTYFQILNIKLIIFFFLFFLSEIFVSLRLKNIINVYPNRITTRDILIINIKSFFLYFIVPGGIGADISRYLNFKYLKKNKDINFLEIIIVDRFIGITSMFLVLIFSFIFVKQEVISFFNFDIKINMAIIFLIFFFILIVGSLMRGYLKRISTSKIIKKKIRKFLKKKELIIKSLVCSLVTNTCLISPIYFISNYLAFDLHFIEICFVISASVFLSMIPLSLLGISGLELGSYFLYSLLGLESEKAFFLVFSLFLFRFMLALIGGVMELASAIKNK